MKEKPIFQRGRWEQVAQGKYETHILPNLDKIIRWAEVEATAKEIAGKLHAAYSTFRKYLDLGWKGDGRYTGLSDVFTQMCEVPSEQVEAALLERACGFECTETRRGRKLDRLGNVVELVTTINKVAPPDLTSAMSWLTNRKPETWKYKPEAQDGDGDEGSDVVLLSSVMDSPGPPTEEGADDG